MVLQRSAPIQLNKINKIAPPGPPNFPLVGTLPFLGKYLHVELHKLAKKYGNIYQLHVGRRKLLVLNGLEVIQEALVKQPDCFNSKVDFAPFKQPPMRYLIEFKSGEVWKQHRAMAGKVIHSFLGCQLDKLESYAMEETAELTNIFLNSGGKAFDPNLYIPLATLSLMQKLMFSKEGSFKNNQEDANFVTTAHGLRTIANGSLTATNLETIPAIWRPIYLFSHGKSLLNLFQTLNKVNSFYLQNIKEHEESFDAENLRGDITDALLKVSREQTESNQKNLRLSANDILFGTVAQFMSPGTEISRVILHWGLLYMIAYPEIQTQIQKELDEVIGREQQPSLQHRGQLPFTEACINEIFRHASPTTLPAVPYKTIGDTTLSGYFIPEKTLVLVNYYSLTRDERYWEEPEQFNPYRFLDEKGKLRKDLLDKFYPFGIGPRRCIGEYLGRLQIFLFFTNLMHKCKFQKVDRKKLNLEPQPGSFGSANKYKVIAKPRF